jgi:hypothetical protein
MWDGGAAGVRLRCVQPELKAVLQPYGADRVSACGARAAGVLSGAWLVGWLVQRSRTGCCSLRPRRTGRKCRRAPVRAQGQRRRARRVWLDGVGRAAAWVGAVEARKGGTNYWCRRCCSRMLELTQPTRMGTTRHATILESVSPMRVVAGRRVAVVADDGAAWSECAAVARVDGHRRDGDGHVSVAVSTVGLALHLLRVNGPRRAAWNIARVPTGWLDERRGQGRRLLCETAVRDGCVAWLPLDGALQTAQPKLLEGLRGNMFVACKGRQSCARFDSWWSVSAPCRDTALHRASRHGHTESVRALLEKGAAVNAADNAKCAFSCLRYWMGDGCPRRQRLCGRFG